MCVNVHLGQYARAKPFGCSHVYITGLMWMASKCTDGKNLDDVLRIMRLHTPIRVQHCN